MSTYHVYACARNEPAKRVLMYDVGQSQIAIVIVLLGMRRSDLPVSPGDSRLEFAGYYVDAMGGLWWVKRYD